jgi:BolA family transcriptional regulator, general stress-responsive regulator
MPETTLDRIRDRLVPLEPLQIELRDDSASHAGHAGAASGGGHYELRLVSAQFTGQSKIARHRLVYHLLGDLMQREIHALAMNLLAPDEVERAPVSGPTNSDFSPSHSSGH